MRFLRIVIVFAFSLLLLAAPAFAAGEDDPFAPVVGESSQAPQTGAESNAAAQEQAPAPSSQSDAPAVPNLGPLKPVSPAEFVGRVNALVGDINTAIAGIVVPLATFGMLVSCAVLAVGSLVGLQSVKRFGWGGLLTASVGLLVFYGIPVILGLIKALAGRFAV